MRQSGIQNFDYPNLSCNFSSSLFLIEDKTKNTLQKSFFSSESDHRTYENKEFKKQKENSKQRKTERERERERERELPATKTGD